MIRLENVIKIYGEDYEKKIALNNICLEIKDGEFVAVTGPSGSGKSTLMNIIGCLDVATSGKYFLGGQDISLCKENQLNVVRCEKIGFVFQSFNLLPKLSVLQNVELPMVYRGKKAHERKVKAIELLEMVGLGDKLKNKPTELSGGQRQRLVLARALLKDSPIYIMDEATSNIDVESENKIMEVLYELSKEKLVLCISHRLENLKRANQIYCLKDRNIVESGSHEELLQQNGVYCELFNTQEELERYGA